MSPTMAAIDKSFHLSFALLFLSSISANAQPQGPAAYSYSQFAAGPSANDSPSIPLSWDYNCYTTGFRCPNRDGDPACDAPIPQRYYGPPRRR
jgi:hypothetical protein